MIYFCYIDESGTPEIPGTSTHYVLAGISIPVLYWKKCEEQIGIVKKKYNLEENEIHTAWINRPYIEQSKIVGFDKLDYSSRRSVIEKHRKTELFKLQKNSDKKHYRQTKKNYNHTNCYIHLTFDERKKFIQEIADLVGKWSFARIFCESIDKIFFDPRINKKPVDEQALEQLVSRFEHYLQIINKSKPNQKLFGALIHDNNETVSKKHTQLMKNFHTHGTLWTKIEKIIETPLFVNSELTSLIQIADLCSYSIRRFCENGETDLIDRIKSRFDKKDNKIVGVRHFSEDICQCFICKSTSIKVVKTQ